MGNQSVHRIVDVHQWQSQVSREVNQNDMPKILKNRLSLNRLKNTVSKLARYFALKKTPIMLPSNSEITFDPLSVAVVQVVTLLF